MNSSETSQRTEPPAENNRSRRVFWILSIAAFCSMLGVGIIVPFLPNYTKSIGASSYFIVGLIFSSMNLSRLIFLPVMRNEAESGRIKQRTILIEGLAFYVFLSFAYIFASNALALGIVRFFNGFAAAMVIPVCMAMIGNLAPVMGEGREMGDFQASIMAGFGIGPLIGGALNQIAGYWAAFGTMGILNLIALLLVVFYLPRESLPEVKNTAVRKKAPPYKAALASKIVMAVLIFRFINSVGRGASFSFIPVLAKGPKLHLQDIQIGLIVTSIALVVGIFSGLAGRLADRFSRLKLVVIGSLGFTACITFMPFCDTFAELLGVSVLSGIFGAVGNSASAAISVVEGRKFGMITIMTLFEMAMSFGLFFGPPIGGLFGDRHGLEAAFYFSAVVNFFGTGLFYVLLRNSEANRTKECASDETVKL